VTRGAAQHVMKAPVFPASASMHALWDDAAVIRERGSQARFRRATPGALKCVWERASEHDCSLVPSSHARKNHKITPRVFDPKHSAKPARASEACTPGFSQALHAY
jgi:hypothetical protein